MRDAKSNFKLRSLNNKYTRKVSQLRDFGSCCTYLTTTFELRDRVSSRNRHHLGKIARNRRISSRYRETIQTLGRNLEVWRKQWRLRYNQGHKKYMSMSCKRKTHNWLKMQRKHWVMLYLNTQLNNHLRRHNKMMIKWRSRSQYPTN